eukprot:2810549-Pleurochrysis_carterae.AAC.1
MYVLVYCVKSGPSIQYTFIREASYKNIRQRYEDCFSAAYKMADCELYDILRLAMGVSQRLEDLRRVNANALMVEKHKVLARAAILRGQAMPVSISDVHAHLKCHNAANKRRMNRPNFTSLSRITNVTPAHAIAAPAASRFTAWPKRARQQLLLFALNLVIGVARPAGPWNGI